MRLRNQGFSAVYNPVAGGYRVVKDDNPLFTDEDLKKIGELMRALENECGHPVNVEGSVKDDQVFLLQCRPVAGRSGGEK